MQDNNSTSVIFLIIDIRLQFLLVFESVFILILILVFVHFIRFFKHVYVVSFFTFRLV